MLVQTLSNIIRDPAFLEHGNANEYEQDDIVDARIHHEEREDDDNEQDDHHSMSSSSLWLWYAKNHKSSEKNKKKKTKRRDSSSSSSTKFRKDSSKEAEITTLLPATIRVTTTSSTTTTPSSSSHGNRVPDAIPLSPKSDNSRGSVSTLPTAEDNDKGTTRNNPQRKKKRQANAHAKTSTKPEQHKLGSLLHLPANLSSSSGSSDADEEHHSGDDATSSLSTQLTDEETVSLAPPQSQNHDNNNSGDDDAALRAIPQKSVSFAEDDTTTVAASRHKLSPKDMDRLWYSAQELYELRRDLVLVDAQTVIHSTHWKAAKWWRALLYLDHGRFQQEENHVQSLQMRAKLVVAYLQADALVGLERTLLNFLHEGDTEPRASMVARMKQCAGDAATLAEYQTQVSQPFVLLAHELAVAQAEALQLQEIYEEANTMTTTTRTTSSRPSKDEWQNRASC